MGKSNLGEREKDPELDGKDETFSGVNGLPGVYLPSDRGDNDMRSMPSVTSSTPVV